MDKDKIMHNLPNMLCYFRIAMIPVIVFLFYFDNAFIAWLNVFIFAIAGLSDFFDGYIARSTGQSSVLGKFLDSTSDKMLIGAVLVSLVAFGRLEGLWIIPAIIIILREILVSGMREFMALYNVSAPVSQIAKWKTTVQMVFMGFLIAGPYGESLIPHAWLIGKLGLLVATVLTVISGWDYLREALKTMQGIEEKG